MTVKPYARLTTHRLLKPTLLLLMLFAVACAPAVDDTANRVVTVNVVEDTTTESTEATETAPDEAQNEDEVEREPETAAAEPEESEAITSETDGSETEMAESDADTGDDDGESETEAMVETDVSDQMNRRSNAEILTTDDRSPQLQSLTTAWNTDWALRTISTDEILSGGPPRDGIPPIDNPTFETPESAAAWLQGNEPVISVEINGEARAYPLQIMTWHEIVNDELGGTPILVTFCPLCNSAIVFDRHVDGEIFDFGTSGLLRNSDLIMYDRQTESLWQQFIGEGIVGEKAAVRLNFIPSLLISFDDFVAQHPDGEILSVDTGFNRQYGRNPYAGYDTIGSNPFLFDGVIDGRLAATERVITIAAEDIGIDVAYPLSVLTEAGVINDTQGETDIAVFHDPGTSSALGASQISEGDDVGAAGVYSPIVNGETLSFEKADNQIIDSQTGSVWNIHGVATDGELAGTQLEPIIHANHFWFAWAAFKPETIIYEG